MDGSHVIDSILELPSDRLCDGECNSSPEVLVGCFSLMLILSINNGNSNFAANFERGKNVEL
jgi:hypothetical protein